MTPGSADLARLVELITAEVMATLGRGGSGSVQCACHGVLHECCPTRVRGLLEAGATRLGLHAGGGQPGEVANLIDHTLLKPEATRTEVEALCREAAEFRFATVCVNPVWVQTASRLLQHSGVGVCAVVGFPLGALKSGDLKTVERDIEAVADTCREGGALSKVIIEAALLTDEEKVTACTLAKAAGADYVKTSTGFARSGATVADVQLMRRVVGPEMGVKAAGGVRDLEQVKAMAAAGASRIGASAGVKIVRESRGEKVGAPASGY